MIFHRQFSVLKVHFPVCSLRNYKNGGSLSTCETDDFQMRSTKLIFLILYTHQHILITCFCFEQKFRNVAITDSLFLINVSYGKTQCCIDQQAYSIFTKMVNKTLVLVNDITSTLSSRLTTIRQLFPNHPFPSLRGTRREQLCYQLLYISIALNNKSFTVPCM